MLVLRKENLTRFKKKLFLAGTLLLSGCVPSTIPISYDDLAMFKGESAGITIFIELKPKVYFVLPGDRYIVYVYNQSDSTLFFDYDNDEYLYYTSSQVFKAHLFKAGGVLPRWVAPGQVASIGILTDRKGLTIAGFEAYFSKSGIKVFAGSVEVNN